MAVIVHARVRIFVVICALFCITVVASCLRHISSLSVPTCHIRRQAYDAIVTSLFHSTHGYMVAIFGLILFTFVLSRDASK